MKEDRRRYWQAYVDELRILMELRDWEVRLLPDPTEPLSHTPGDSVGAAQIECLYGRKVANLKLAEEWDDYAPEEQRTAVVHELVHCHLTGAADTVCDGMLSQVMGEPAYQTLRNAYLRHLEYGVDAIAEGWAGHLPLPGDAGMTEAQLVALFDGDPTPEQYGAALTPEDDQRPPDPPTPPPGHEVG